MKGRNSDGPDVVARRFAEARDDVRKWRKFRYVLINDDLDDTCRRMSSIFEGSGDQHAVSDARCRDLIENRIATGGWGG